MKKRLTPNQKIFYSEIERIQRAVKRYQKKGYIFSDDIIPEKPARITKKYLTELKKLRGRKIAAQGTQTISKTRNLTRDVAGEPPRLTAMVLNNVRELLSTWQPLMRWSNKFVEIKKQDKNTLRHLLDGAIAEEGEANVAMRLEVNAEEVIRLVETIIYGNSGAARDGGDYARASIVAFGRIIKGRSLTLDESIELTEFSDFQTV